MSLDKLMDQAALAALAEDLGVLALEEPQDDLVPLFLVYDTVKDQTLPLGLCKRIEVYPKQSRSRSYYCVSSRSMQDASRMTGGSIQFMIESCIGVTEVPGSLKHLIGCHAEELVPGVPYLYWLEAIS